MLSRKMKKRSFPGGSAVKNPLVKQGMWVHSLGQDNPLEKEMATHSSVLACKILWTEEPGGLQSMRLQKSQTPLSDGTTTAYRKTHTTYLWQNANSGNTVKVNRNSLY